MFTGLVQAVSPIVRLDGHSLEVEWPSEFLHQGPKIGESIAVNGCCLTLVSAQGSARFELSPETLDRTALRHLTVGTLVNLERALRAGDSIGGHFVQGHVDGIGHIESISENDGFYRILVEAPESGEALLIDKGSIAIDGISLTVIAPKANRFEVAIVPHTWRTTNLSNAKAETPVNIEFDMLAKHVQRLLTFK